MNYLNKPSWNYLALLIVVLISTLLVALGDYSDSAGASVYVMVWVPLICGILTALLYGISRLLIKRYNWIITLLGILFLLNASIQFYL